MEQFKITTVFQAVTFCWLVGCLIPIKKINFTNCIWYWYNFKFRISFFAENDKEAFVKPKNYYKIISENKEITRIYMTVSSTLYLLETDVKNVLQVSNY